MGALAWLENPQVKHNDDKKETKSKFYIIIKMNIYTEQRLLNEHSYCTAVQHPAVNSMVLQRYY